MINKKYIDCCLIVLVIAFTCCARGKICKSPSPSEYKDSTYLEVHGNLYEFKGLDQRDFMVLRQARQRISKYMYIDHGIIKWNISSGKEVNVAENLFRYITYAWAHDNNLIEIGLYKLQEENNGYSLKRAVMPQEDTINSPDIDNLDWKYDGISYKDSIFLRIEGDLEQDDEPWNKFYKTYSRAVDRMNQHMYIENGRIKCKIKRGIEIKISENIFLYLNKMYYIENEKLETGKYEIRRNKCSNCYFAIPMSQPLDTTIWEQIK